MIRATFAETYREIAARIEIFTSLPLGSLDRLALKRKLDEIGASRTSAPQPVEINASVLSAYRPLLSAPGVAQGDGAVEHRRPVPVVLAIGHEITEAFELEMGAGTGERECRLDHA